MNINNTAGKEIPVYTADYKGTTSLWGTDSQGRQVRTEYTVACLFGGYGGGGVGIKRSRGQYKGQVGKFKVLCSLDVDPTATTKNYERLTGETNGRVIDLFSRRQYIDFHGSDLLRHGVKLHHGIYGRHSDSQFQTVSFLHLLVKVSADYYLKVLRKRRSIRH